jgi:putative NADH-flavin reductase
MNLLIFGASGATGHELVKQSLAQGHVVTAFVRNLAKLAIKHERLKVLQGDVKDYFSVERAVKGQDAVCSALGVSKPLKKDPAVVDGVKNIIGAMVDNKVKRLVYLSTNAVGDSRRDAGFLIRHVIARIVHNEIIDHEQKEKLILSSSLDWTIVRAPALTKGPLTGVYRSGEAIKASALLPMMSRADVADFMLRQLTQDTFIRKTPRILK